MKELGRANIALMLSWHEGFGLTGWEAVAGEVPLIISRDSGLWQLLKETLGERIAEGYVRTVRVRGKEGGDDTANFLAEDERDVRDAIIDCAANLEDARKTAVKLKKLLIDELFCTWENTAKQFLDGLGIEQTQPTTPVSPDPEQPPPPPPPQPVPRSDFIAIPKLSWPEDLAAKCFVMPDSMLLRAESRIVRFHSLREPLRDEIIGWALNPDQLIKLRLQAGEAGAGKTRLLIEVCDHLEHSHGWRAGFVERSRSISGGFSALLKEGKSCLIVLDYAETRTGEIVEITKTALYALNRPQVRLVLLARDGGDWWNHLDAAAGSDQNVAAILAGHQTKTGPYRMANERVEKNDREAIFREALEDFASFKKAAVPADPVPDLSGEKFGNPLFIHLAALATLRGRPSVDDQELLAMAIGHERSYWRQLLSAHGMSDGMLPALEQAVALLTLCNGKPTTKDAKAVLARTPRLRELDPSLRITLFDALRRLYPLDGGLTGLRPDLLGETLVSDVLASDDEVLDAAFGQDCSREDMRYALTVLTRLGRRVPEEQRYLRRALERNLTKISEDAVDVGMETGSPMPEILGKVISAAAGHERKQTVNELRFKIPKETLNLRGLKVAILRQSIEFLENKTTGKGAKRDIGLYEGFLALSVALKQAGLLAEAADAASEAQNHAQMVFRSDSENDRNRLAAAFSNLGIRLSDVGRFDEALAAEKKAEEIRRGLAEKQPDAYTADWAQSLANLAISLVEVGRFAEALEKAEKAEEIRRGLAEKQPDAYSADWATSLGNLGSCLGDVGRFDEALAATKRAEEIRRGLAEKQPDAYSADLATSLGNLGSCLRDVGRFEGALQKTEKAEEIRRGLAEKQPDAYSADWATSLGNLSFHLRDLERYAHGLNVAEKAEEIWRGLAEKQPDAYSADWARSLTYLAEAQLSAGKFNVALDTAKEAVVRIRPFADRYPPVYKPWLGSAQRITADASFKMERLDQALADARHSVETWIEVATQRQHYVFVEAAKAFRALMKCEIALGQNEAAIATLGRAFDTLCKPLNDNPKPLRPVMSELIDLVSAVDHDSIARVVPSELLAIVRGSSADN